MEKKLQWELPDKKVYQRLGYLREAVKTGQENADVSVFILEGGTEHNRREYAGAVAYGCEHLEPLFFPNKEEEKEAEEKREEKNKVDMELEELFKDFKEDDLKRFGEKAPKMKLPQESETDGIEAVEIVLKTIYDNKEERESYNNQCTDELYRMCEDSVRKTKLFLLSGEITTTLEEFVFQCVRDCVKSGGKVFIIAESFSENYIRKLQFQEGAVRVHVSAPTMKDYEIVMLDEIEKIEMQLEDKTEMKDVIGLNKSILPDEFGMEFIKDAVEKAAVRAKKDNRKVLKLCDFNCLGKEYKDPEKMFQQTVGLEKVKRKMERMVAVNCFERERRGPDFSHGNCHMAFAGNPGTGKSMAGKLFAEILTKYGITNGKFVMACKNDYVGAYVGHTARKMRELFHKARGGVIFFDEAGALLTNDDYAKEARTELVRFMELYPDVICIFASYEHNIRHLLEMDAGLRSRIMEILTFEDYTDTELYEIFCLRCREEDYHLEEGAREVFTDYVKSMREENPKTFGNGRLARNLFLKAKELLALDVMQTKKNPLDIQVLSTKFIREAVKELEENSLVPEKNRVGFLPMN